MSSSPILQVANPERDPEGLITKYVQFESFRLVRDHHLDDMTGSLQDRLKVLMWYLTDYQAHRKAQGTRFEMPLSRAQVAFLNRPMPLAGLSPAVTVALYNSVVRELPSHLNLADVRVLREAVYWWCFERTIDAKLHRALVTREQIAVLQAPSSAPYADFPFNIFMEIQFERDRAKLDLTRDKASDRAAYLCYLILSSYTRPYLRSFLPGSQVRQLLRARAEAASLFDEIIAAVALPPGAPPSRVAALRGQAEALAAKLARQGAGESTAEVRDYGEFLLPKRDFPRSHPEPGVALIGPLLQTSGLGQATRISYEILTAAERVRPTALPFGLDNPAPIGFATELNFETFTAPREINLIHLNAESIPLVYAFEQREIVANSYNIGYFFWELNQIPKCHNLALDLLDEIWVSSEYNREIYARFTDKPVVNVGMAVEPLPEVEAMDLGSLGLERDATIFLTTFDSFSFIERKNPLAAVEAFRQAFPLGTEAVALVIKTQNRTRVGDPHQVAIWRKIDDACRADPRILIVDETLKYRDLLALKKACDCYVSLHRSEGWGFGMIEAMQLERPVIATAYGGNMDFCSEESAYLIGYDLVGVQRDEYIFVERGSVWADADLRQAAAAMRHVATDRAAARAKGVSAARLVKARFSIPAIAKRYGARLEEIRAAPARRLAAS
ncbi:glycosyltransferase [Methylobacterium sp. WSM2598]|uniref:glycosyltransferase n=1 Tax=Methylobacterium sp. WSM2598 TaxID=398261 RepID=UPI0003696D29|nr:glycosyltransferase [Methylobacterium sp. WSM2598]